MSKGISRLQKEIMKEIFKHKVETPRDSLIACGYFYDFSADLRDVLFAIGMGRSPSSFYRAVRNLKERELVFLSDRGDKGRKYVTLTEKGQAMIEYNLRPERSIND